MEYKLLNYSLQGNGNSTIVLLHGFCENKSIWKDLITGISKDITVITIDLPGFGGSNLCLSNPSIEHFAKEIHQLLMHLNVTSCVMVGHSLGGYVALAYAEYYPSYLQGLVMFHSSAFADNEEKKANRNKSIEFVKTHGTAPFVNTLIPSLFKESNRKQFAGVIERLITEASSIAPQAIIDASIAMRERTDRTHILKEIDIPVLYIIGKVDEAIPLKASLEQCHLAYKSHAYFLSESAHMGMIEEVDNTTKAINHFIGYCTA